LTAAATPPTAVETGPVVERALLFELGGRSYGLRLSAVDGMGETGPVRRVPMAPDEVFGLTEWRGRLLTVLNLEILLGQDGGGSGEPCLVCLAPPLERTALWVPAGVRLGWVPSAGETANSQPLHSLPRQAPPGRDADPPQLIEPSALVRRIAVVLEG
jgi:hypothetical protein